MDGNEAMPEATDDGQPKHLLWRGALCSILAPPTLLVLFAWMLRPIPPSGRLLRGVGHMFMLATPVTLLATLCLGLPLVLALRALKALSWKSVCLGAMMIGAAAFALFVWLLLGNRPAPSVFHYVLGAVFGLVSGASFCIGARLESSSRPIQPGEPG